MIKKNTKIIIEGEDSSKFEALQGGIPLSKGEIITLHEGTKTSKYKVKEKQVECFLDREDQIVNITYTLIRV